MHVWLRGPINRLSLKSLKTHLSTVRSASELLAFTIIHSTESSLLRVCVHQLLAGKDAGYQLECKNCNVKQTYSRLEAATKAGYVSSVLSLLFPSTAQPQQRTSLVTTTVGEPVEKPQKYLFSCTTLYGTRALSRCLHSRTDLTKSILV